MNVTEKIVKQIEKITEGITFGYAELNITQEEFLAAAKVLERLLKKGVIQKVSKGKFFKPKETVFGVLEPNEQEILKPYLFKDGKRIAYITGPTLYNQLGFTRQISAKIKIASRDKRIKIQAGTIKTTPVKSYVDVTDTNYELLGLLDALKDFKKIPDLDTKSAVIILSNYLKNLSNPDLKRIIKFSLSYPARTRALLGALLEFNNKTKELEMLKKSLNPLTQYDLKLKKYLPTAINWNIE